MILSMHTILETGITISKMVLVYGHPNKSIMKVIG